ncbi:hypothetical protein L5515_005420 [Caenorhabditis briggsae]|uniref:Uncharacterized protein n=1 Tax=Caenorhabditis briggsae TaxID=6238 RepID=A0AAE9EQJ4_CAEBR|nr:hypothetical protein L5515_005420 [Caenorhabditis briggsae]
MENSENDEEAKKVQITPMDYPYIKRPMGIRFRDDKAIKKLQNRSTEQNYEIQENPEGTSSGAGGNTGN